MNVPTIKLIISSNFTTSGTVYSAFPGVNQNFTVVPGLVTQLTLPADITLQGGIEDKGIRITSADPISLYGLNSFPEATDAFMALPVPALGTDYRIVTFKQIFTMAGSCFSVVAVQDGTSLTVYNHQTNSTTNVNLNMGQTYHVKTSAFHEDLTGSRVQSNVPVAVFGSVDGTNVPEGCSSIDHLVEQMFPYYSWGKNYVTVSLAGRASVVDIFRVVAAEDGTDIKVNGTLVNTIDAGDHHEMYLPGYNSITTSKAALLAQFARGFSCSGGMIGDPFMMLIPPTEQFLTNYTICNVVVSNPATDWVNVVAPGYALGTIYQDGVLIPDAAFTQISSTTYYGAQRQVSSGTHTFNSTFPFGVFVYGWGFADSYGYPGGCSLSPVGTVNSVTLSPDTSYGQLNITNVCLTAHVNDNFSNPVVGVLVTFHVIGINPITGNAYTDAAGNAQYCYTQTGTSTVTDHVYADIFGFTSDTSVVIWNYIPPCANPTNGGTIGSDQNGCGNYVPSLLTSILLPSGQSGTLEYKWQFSAASSSSGFADIPGSNAASYSPGIITQTTWFKRVARVNCMNDWSGAVESNVIEMTVIDPLPVSISISSSANSFCPGSPVTFTSTPVNGGPNPSYQWKVNGNNAGTNSPSFSYNPAINDSILCVMTSGLACVTGNPATSNKIILSESLASIVTFTTCFDTITTVNAKPFKLKGGIPLNGIYSGTGVNPATGIFDPASAGQGSKTITYTYTNVALCSASKTKTIIVQTAPLFACGNNLTDIRDNKVYPTVQIGSQCWMAKNLDFGSQVSDLIPQTDNCIPEKYAYPSFLIPRPSFYQWDELMKYEDTEGSQGFCPPGWHVPTSTDWNNLLSFYNDAGQAGGPIKDQLMVNGFHSVQQGFLYLNNTWAFLSGFYAGSMYWTSTSSGANRAVARGLNEYHPGVSYYPSSRANAFSVRCLKD